MKRWKAVARQLHVIMLLLCMGMMSGCMAIGNGGSVHTEAYEGKAQMAGYETTLYQMPPESVQTRWYTFENRNAEKGAGGQARHGRKGSPAPTLAPHETFVLADIEGPGTTRRIWSTIIAVLENNH